MLFDCRCIHWQQIARRGRSVMSSFALFTAGMYWTGLGRQITHPPVPSVMYQMQHSGPLYQLSWYSLPGRLLAAAQSSRVRTQHRRTLF